MFPGFEGRIGYTNFLPNFSQEVYEKPTRSGSFRNLLEPRYLIHYVALPTV